MTNVTTAHNKIKAALNKHTTPKLKEILVGLYTNKAEESHMLFCLGCDVLEERVGGEGLDAFFDANGM